MTLAESELVQKPETITTVRCPTCQGLRAVTRRNLGVAGQCPSCRRGNVVPRTQFHNYWLERFSLDEIRDMGRAIWG